VTRAVDGKSSSLLDETQATVELYRQLDDDKGRLLFEFGLLYLAFALMLILAAVWLGLPSPRVCRNPWGAFSSPRKGWGPVTSTSA
jgi:nitrogen fixation/metabolism regulation signal transduction histidine kinase